MDISFKGYVPDRYAADPASRQFEPSSETHHFGFMVKAVDPGCTLEVQIEEIDGRVTRITTTENTEADKREIEASVLQALNRFMALYGIA